MEIFSEKLVLFLTGMPLYRNGTHTDIINTESNFLNLWHGFLCLEDTRPEVSKGYTDFICGQSYCLAPLRRTWSILLTPSLQVLTDIGGVTSQSSALEAE